MTEVQTEFSFSDFVRNLRGWNRGHRGPGATVMEGVDVVEQEVKNDLFGINMAIDMEFLASPEENRRIAKTLIEKYKQEREGMEWVRKLVKSDPSLGAMREAGYEELLEKKKRDD